MSSLDSCDYDIVSIPESLSGFPGQQDEPIEPMPMPLAVAENLRYLEMWRDTDRARIEALEAARAAGMTGPYEFPPGVDIDDVLYGLDDIAGMAEFERLERLGILPRLPPISEVDEHAYDPPYPPTRPPSPSSSYAHDAPTDRSPIDASSDDSMPRLATPTSDSTGNDRAVIPYIPPARRQAQAPRTLYATLIPGVFDTEAPSDKRTAEFMAG